MAQFLFGQFVVAVAVREGEQGACIVTAFGSLSNFSSADRLR